MRISEENLKGRTVITADGLAIGQIISIYLETERWTVDAVQVVLRRPTAERLGAPRSIFQRRTLEIPVRFIQSVGDAVVLSAPVEGLRQLVPEGAPAGEAQH